MEGKELNKLKLKIETDFYNTMMGISELPQKYPRTYYSNYLKAAYDQATAMKLPEDLRLKYCCVVLTKIINDHLTEKIDEAMNKVH